MGRENPARARSDAEVAQSQRVRGIGLTTSRLVVIMRRVPIRSHAPPARRVWKLTRSSMLVDACVNRWDATAPSSGVAESKKQTSWRIVGASNTSVEGSESASPTSRCICP
eukprot:6677527-Prymnesium_polylepis.1